MFWTVKIVRNMQTKLISSRCLSELLEGESRSFCLISLMTQFVVIIYPLKLNLRFIVQEPPLSVMQLTPRLELRDRERRGQDWTAVFEVHLKPHVVHVGRQVLVHERACAVQAT